MLLSAFLTLMPLASAIAIDRKPQASDRILDQVRPRSEALKRAKTALIEFETSPFPYDGIEPEKDIPFLDVTSGERRGHRMPSGRIHWEDETYRERRALLHIPKGYDFTRPVCACPRAFAVHWLRMSAFRLHLTPLLRGSSFRRCRALSSVG